MKYLIPYIALFMFAQFAASPSFAQLWHNKARTLHYKPAGKDFVLHKGTKKFNRALYGTNTAFRVETGDLPEFALYMPGMGGNCKIGIIINNKSKWITGTANIKTVYRPGSMLYEIRDPLLNNGVLKITVLALADAEGMIVQTETLNTPAGLSLIVAYGGATGKKFSRDGDIGADPESSFYLQPAYCKDNQYALRKNSFQLYYGFTKPLSEDARYEIQYGKKTLDTAAKDKPKQISGLFPATAVLKIGNAEKQNDPATLVQAAANHKAPLLTAQFNAPANKKFFFIIEKAEKTRSYEQAAGLYQKAEAARKKIAERITIETPDEYINTLGSALAIAADGIWEAPGFLHGAVAWRMRLPAWRGAYAADALGWQERARMHFDSYLKSQVTNIAPGPVTPDTALHFARQLEKMGTSMFSNGYICRNPDGKIQPHHYDMNLVFIDQLLTHLNYTGDLNYARKIWPSLQLHLQWEKRNYDADNDGLYDAYACIWASDALQYSGGGVTHSSAYNYRANKMAGQIARLLQQDPAAYEQEADKILAAMNRQLWLTDKGWFAEYKDLNGLQLTHDHPGLWTIYHAIDEGTATPQQRFQMLRYIDRHIPHIPVQANELPFDDLKLLATTNWQPYTWSINNVALAENLHTALAYWQSGENEAAFNLWKSNLVESMYLSSSPGGFQQLSFYDAVRGELYRDFADPIGIAARTLTEGLFGIVPDALNGNLIIQPGLPAQWKFARLHTPNISFSFKAINGQYNYIITPAYPKQLNLLLRINAPKDRIAKVLVNGKEARYRWIPGSLHSPVIEVEAGKQATYNIQIVWAGRSIEKIKRHLEAVKGQAQTISYTTATIQSVNNPQQTIKYTANSPNSFSIAADTEGQYSIFVTLQQGQASWIAPLSVNIIAPVVITTIDDGANAAKVLLVNRTASVKTGLLNIHSYTKNITLNAGDSLTLTIPANALIKGTNPAKVTWNDGTVTQTNLACWNVPATGNYEQVPIGSFMNENVTRTFSNQYLSPRTSGTTLQIPWQGIGNWCYPLIQPEISDAGIQNKHPIFLEKIPFKMEQGKNIVYTSQWDNFPNTVTIPLKGKARHAYLLMAGTTNHQQSQMTNGIVYITYKDGSRDSLELINPVNWWPIEQDYLDDGYAFKAGPRPYRLLFKTATFTRHQQEYVSIKGFSNTGIEGGAGTALDIPLNARKELLSLTLKAITNEVLIGLMAVTLKTE